MQLNIIRYDIIYHYSKYVKIREKFHLSQENNIRYTKQLKTQKKFEKIKIITLILSKTKNRNNDENNE